MKARGWSRRELARRARLTVQSVSHLVNPDRDHLGRMLEQRTIDGLALALGVPADEIMTKAAEAMGVTPRPGSDTNLEDVVRFLSKESVPDAVLLELLKRRFEESYPEDN